MDEDVRQQKFRATEPLASGPEKPTAQDAPKHTLPKRIYPTRESSKDWERLYDALNPLVADGKLRGAKLDSACLRRSRGYYLPGRWDESGAGLVADTIWLDSVFVREHPIEEVFALLAGLMLKQLQYIEGTAGRTGYGNRDFANRLKAFGLQASHNGEPGGREIGDSIRWYIVTGGAFEKIAAKLKAKGLTIRWHERVTKTSQAKGSGTDDKAAPKKSRKRKVKYVCPGADCGLEAEAKPGIESLMCADHGVRLVPAENNNSGGAR